MTGDRKTDVASDLEVVSDTEVQDDINLRDDAPIILQTGRITKRNHQPQHFRDDAAERNTNTQENGPPLQSTATSPTAEDEPNASQAAPPKRLSRTTAIVGMVALVGVAIRAILLASPFGRIDPNEAITQLMGTAFMKGDVSAFTWGHQYGGTLEAMITAVFYAVAGVSTFTTKLVPVTLFALSAIVLWRIGLKTVGKRAALVGAGLFWIAPLAYVLLSTKAYGYYGVTLLATLLAVHAILRLVRSPHTTTALGAGLLSGIAVWSSPHALVVLTPVVISALISRVSLLTRFIPAIAAFAVGIAPAIVQNIRSKGASFDLIGPVSGGVYFDRIRSFFTDALPIALGVRVPFRQGPVIPYLDVAAMVALGTFVAVSLIRRRHELTEFPKRIGMIALTLLAFPLLYALLPIDNAGPDAHHIMLWWPFAALLIAWCFARREIALLATAALFTVISAFSLQQWTHDHDDQSLTPVAIGKTASFLNDNNITTLYADDVLADRITAQSRSAVVATPLYAKRTPTLVARGVNETTNTNEPTRTAVALLATGRFDKQFDRSLTEEGHRFDRINLDGVAIYRIDDMLTRSDVRELISD